MAGLEPARACYGPTDFKSVSLLGHKARVAVLLPLLADFRIEIRYARHSKNSAFYRDWLILVDELNERIVPANSSEASLRLDSATSTGKM